MSDFIPYQVDYSVQNAAKTIGFSKKRVTFKFGFADRKALALHKSGPECRGSEHELLYVWSLSSGKRQLILDNKDLHFSESGMNGWTSDREFNHSFTLRDRTGGVHRLQFVSQIVGRDMVNARPFDLLISGMSYFNFNKLFQLGTPQMIVGAKERQNNFYGRDSPLNHEERQQIAMAKLASLKDLAHQEEQQVQRFSKVAEIDAPPVIAAPASVEAPLISFDDEPTTASTSSLRPPPVPNAVPIPSQPSLSQVFGASSVTFDGSFDEQETSRRSLYGTSNNPYTGTTNNSNNYDVNGSSTNLYGANTYGSNPYGSNPYAGATSSSYNAAPSFAGVAPYTSSQNPSDGSADNGNNSNALTPYYAGGGQQQQQYQQQAYVDATGRLSVGQPPAPQPSNSAYSNASYYAGGGYDSNSNYYGTAAAASINSTHTPDPSLTSPSNQTQYSYGSAPSFAQPPSYSFAQAPPPPPPPMGMSSYSSYGYPSPSSNPTPTYPPTASYPSYNY